MSADNGIYVGEFPTTDGQKEFRVAERSAIDNCFWDKQGKEVEDAYRVLYFGDSACFRDEDAAAVHAYKRSKEYYTEYGVVHLKFDRPLSDMSRERAEKIVRA